MSTTLQLALTGTANLAMAIKAFRSTIMLGPAPDSTTITWNPLSTITALKQGGVIIKAEMCRQVVDSDVSYQLIMAAQGDKKWVTDNVAPQPFSWQISGYITAYPIEVSALVGISTLVQKNRLIKMRDSTSVLSFRDMDSQIHNVVMPKLEFAPTGEVMNGIPITMTLQQVIGLTTVGETMEEAYRNGMSTQDFARDQGTVLPSSF